MILSMQRQEIQAYIARQLNNIFPDKSIVLSSDFDNVIDIALDRLDYCFQRVSFTRYNNGRNTVLNHLYADQYMVFLWFLSNTLWKEKINDTLCNKLYYLNKSLHSLDCMYNTELPDIFLIFHGAGTMLGKASYSNYFVALQGCTVGSHKGKYPSIGQGVALAAHSSLIGDCTIGDRVTISSNTAVYQTDVPSNSIVYRDSMSGNVTIKSTVNSYSQSFFNTEI